MLEQGGAGLFQILAFITIALQTNSVGWYIYNLGYLTLQPEYNCV